MRSVPRVISSQCDVSLAKTKPTRPSLSRIYQLRSRSVREPLQFIINMKPLQSLRVVCVKLRCEIASLIEDSEGYIDHPRQVVVSTCKRRPAFPAERTCHSRICVYHVTLARSKCDRRFIKCCEGSDGRAGDPPAVGAMAICDDMRGLRRADFDGATIAASGNQRRTVGNCHCHRPFEIAAHPDPKLPPAIGPRQAPPSLFATTRCPAPAPTPAHPPSKVPAPDR